MKCQRNIERNRYKKFDIKHRIPVDSVVVGMRHKNVGLNVGLNKTEKAVLSLLIENADRTAEELASEVGGK